MGEFLRLVSIHLARPRKKPGCQAQSEEDLKPTATSAAVTSRTLFKSSSMGPNSTTPSGVEAGTNASTHGYLMFAITRPKVAKSSLMTCRNSSGLLPTGLEFISTIRLRIPGSRIARPISVLIFSSTSAGTFDDVKSANQVLLSKPGKPASTIVGASGAFGSRVGPATARSRTLPSRASSSVVEGEENIACTSPVTSPSAAGIEPG